MSPSAPAMREFTVFDDATPRALEGEIHGGRVVLTRESVRDGLGWELKPEGLCRGRVCIPVSSPDRLLTARGVDLEVLAELAGQPLALEASEGMAVLGARALDRARGLAAGIAPDFSLPDLSGHMQTLSEHRGRKVLLIVYASW